MYPENLGKGAEKRGPRPTGTSEKRKNRSLVQKTGETGRGTGPRSQETTYLAHVENLLVCRKGEGVPPCRHAACASQASGFTWRMRPVGEAPDWRQVPLGCGNHRPRLDTPRW